MLNLSAGGDWIDVLVYVSRIGRINVKEIPLDWTEAFKEWYGQD